MVKPILTQQDCESTKKIQVRALHLEVASNYFLKILMKFTQNRDF